MFNSPGLFVGVFKPNFLTLRMDVHVPIWQGFCPRVEMKGVPISNVSPNVTGHLMYVSYLVPWQIVYKTNQVSLNWNNKLANNLGNRENG